MTELYYTRISNPRTGQHCWRVMGPDRAFELQMAAEMRGKPLEVELVKEAVTE